MRSVLHRGVLERDGRIANRTLAVWRAGSPMRIILRNELKIPPSETIFGMLVEPWRASWPNVMGAC